MKENSLENISEDLIVFAVRMCVTAFWPAIAAAVCAVMLVLPVAAQNTTIAVNGTQGGRTFDGIGAISGGGGNSRLLIDYPAAQQSQILDYLFKPGYGANLQILKVEVGGDANSTDGAEPSIEHTKGTIDCNVGYEWWLMGQAQARNPNIKFYALAWAAPGWIGGGNYWSNDTINYYLSWLNCAKQHGFTISYIGGRNEKGFNTTWYENFHNALHANGFASIKVVAADSVGWSVADTMVSDPTFNAAVDIVGSHYPCGYLKPATSCSTTANALSTGKPLWASENGSQDLNKGAAALIRSITRGYTDAKMTAYINWPLIAALYPNLPFHTDGLMIANSPWSGAYSVGNSLWATAQVTQFTQPGWQIIDSASGYLGGVESNGTYVTLKSTNNVDYTTIIETTTATAAQTVNINVSGGLSTGAVHVWTSNLASPSPGTLFVHSQDITPNGGSYSLTLQPGFIYTLSTTTGQSKGTATSPVATSLSLPYADNFDGYTTGSEAKYLSDMQGAFEVEPCVGGRSGQCVQQMAPIKPIEWEADSDSFALIGDLGWSDYRVQTDVLWQQPGTVELLGRANTQARPPSHQAAYYFRISDGGSWAILSNTTSGTFTTLASGTITAPGVGSWHTMAMTFQGSAIGGYLDGHLLGSVSDSTYTHGQVAIGVVGYQTDQFDNLSVTLLGGGPTSGPIKSGIAGKCVDDTGNSSTNGTPVEIWDCNDGASQNWTPEADGTIRINGKCMDITARGTANGTKVELWDCNGGANQQWAVNGTALINPISGRCLDDPGSSTTNGTQLDIWDCNNGANQQWTLP